MELILTKFDELIWRTWHKEFVPSVIFFTFLDLIISIFFIILGAILLYFNNMDPDIFIPIREDTGLDFSIFAVQFYAVIIGPFIGTIVSQFLILTVCDKLKIKNKYAIIISALFFGISHFDNIFHIISTSIGGLIFATAYISFKDDTGRAILAVYLIHGLHNLIIILLFVLFNQLFS